jgi:hypothetical protein
MCRSFPDCVLVRYILSGIAKYQLWRRKSYESIRRTGTASNHKLSDLKNECTFMSSVITFDNELIFSPFSSDSWNSILVKDLMTLQIVAFLNN